MLLSTINNSNVCVSRSVVSDSLDLMDCSPPGSSVHGILQARILEWIAISLPRIIAIDCHKKIHQQLLFIRHLVSARHQALLGLSWTFHTLFRDEEIEVEIQKA